MININFSENICSLALKYSNLRFYNADDSGNSINSLPCEPLCQNNLNLRGFAK